MKNLKISLWHFRRKLTKYPLLAGVAGRFPGLSFHSDKYERINPIKVKSEKLGTPPSIFLHIPKSGGTTIGTVFHTCTEWSGLKYKHYPVRDFDPPVLICPGWTGAFNSAKRKIDEGENFDFISGHFPFGIHEHLPVKRRYITIVREPLSREKSSFNYLYQQGYLSRKTSLTSLLDEGAIVDNPQTRMLAGVKYMSGICSSETFERAKHNIENHFGLAAPIESAQEVLGVMIDWYGWPPIIYRDRMITKLEHLKTLPESLKSRLKNFHAWDLELYDWVKEYWKGWKEQYLASSLTEDMSGIDCLFQEGDGIPKRSGEEKNLRMLTSDEVKVLLHK